MVINSKDFPKYSKSHYKDLMSYESPIQEHEGYLVKRDDEFEIGNIKGGKVRQCLRIVHDNLGDIKSKYNSGLITGCGLPSPQSTIVSAVSKYFGLKCVVVSPIYDNSKVDVNRINVSLSQKLGAKIYGVGNPNPSGYKLDVKKLKEELGYYEIKFGMNSESVIDSTSHQVKNIPSSLENIIVIAGSGLNLLGIIKGVVRYKKSVKNIYGITLSNFFQENKKLYYDELLDKEKFNGQLHIIPSNYPYQRLLKSNIPFLDWTYENKAYKWMKENIRPSTDTLFWVIGIRNYDLDNVEQIKWNKSSYEKELDIQRKKKKLNGSIKRTNLHQLKSNITYGEIQNLSFPELSKWVDDLRNEIVDLWTTENSPPVIGKSKEDVIKSFQKLKDYDLDKIWIEDKNYPHHIGHIKNFTKVPINQFMPSMHNTRIDRQPSIKEFFFDKSLERRFKRHIVRNTRFDGMHGWTKELSNENGQSHIDFFQDWLCELDEDTGYYLVEANSLEYDENSKKVWLDTKSVKKLVKNGIIDSVDFRNILDFDDTEPEGYMVRWYSKKERIIPKILQVFRLGLGTQPAVNFPPLTARLIYEKYLDNQGENIVWDMCSGFGGRLLGALCANRDIRYLGTDVNKSLVGCYENLSDFYNTNCNGKNTSEIFYEPAETFNHNKTFQKYKGKGNLCFTSPPYFSREIYSLDKEQSCIRYSNYVDWMKGFLEPMIKNCYEFLKPNSYMIINVADVKMGENNFIPLEQNTIEIALKNKFSYEGKIEMTLARMIGVKSENVKNNYFDMKTKRIYKTEPLFVFRAKEK